MNAYLIMARLTGMKPETDDGDDVKWVRCGILVRRAATWGSQKEEVLGCRRGLNYRLTSSHHGDGDDDACLPS